MSTQFFRRILRLLSVMAVLLVGAQSATAASHPFRRLPAPRSQTVPDAFLHPPYFGTTWVTSVYDHEYPVFNTHPNYNETNLANRVNPTEALTITTSVMHYDGNRYTSGTRASYSGHNGIDYGLRYEYVLAAHAGNVIEANWSDPSNHRSGYGLYVLLRHSNDYDTLYGHLSSLSVQAKDPVSTSDLLGISGNTGVSSGPHLHFELEPPNSTQSVNPYGWDGGTKIDPWASTGDATYPGHPSHNLWVDVPSISNTDVYTHGSALTQPTSFDPRLTPQTNITGTVTIEVSPKICTTWSCVYCDPLEVLNESNSKSWTPW